MQKLLYSETTVSIFCYVQLNTFVKFRLKTYLYIHNNFRLLVSIVIYHSELFIFLSLYLSISVYISFRFLSIVVEPTYERLHWIISVRLFLKWLKTGTKTLSLSIEQSLISDNLISGTHLPLQLTTFACPAKLSINNKICAIAIAVSVVTKNLLRRLVLRSVLLVYRPWLRTGL